MDSSVLKNFKSKYKTEEQLKIADKKYISSVYFHTLFLYTITKKKGYQLLKSTEGKPEDIDLGAYLKDIFDSFYSEFILSFGSLDLMEGIGE